MKLSKLPVIVYWNDPALLVRRSIIELNESALAQQVSVGWLGSSGKNYFVVHCECAGDYDFTIIPKALVRKIIRLKEVGNAKVPKKTTTQTK